MKKIIMILAAAMLLSACSAADNYDGAGNYGGIVFDKNGDQVTSRNEDQVTFTTVAVPETSGCFGVAMEVTNATPTGLVLTFTQTEPPPEGYYTCTGSEFVLESYENGVWTELPQQNDIGFLQLPYPISQAKNGRYETAVQWSGIYGILPEGSYRIGKEITMQRVENGVTADSESVMCYADFTIPAEPSYTDFKTDIDYEVRCIRTNGYNEGAEYPQLFWITSAGELTEYYESSKDKYALEHKEEIYSDTTIGFLDAAENYDEDFFAEHNLIIALLEEPSGSIRHKASLLLSPSNLGYAKYFISPLITRIVPYAQTCDMAEWHIIFEVDKEFSPESCKLLDVSFSEENVNDEIITVAETQ